MKHLILFENNSVGSIRDMIKEYHKFLRDIKPAVIEIYNNLAEDDEYEPDYGSKPYPLDASELILPEVGYWDEGLQFVLQSYDSDGEIEDSFYINVNNEELKDMLIGLDANKYNL